MKEGIVDFLKGCACLIVVVVVFYPVVTLPYFLVVSLGGDVSFSVSGFLEVYGALLTPLIYVIVILVAVFCVLCIPQLPFVFCRWCYKKITKKGRRENESR